MGTTSTLATPVSNQTRLRCFGWSACTRVPIRALRSRACCCCVDANVSAHVKWEDPDVGLNCVRRWRGQHLRQRQRLFWRLHHRVCSCRHRGPRYRSWQERRARGGGRRQVAVPWTLSAAGDGGAPAAAPGHAEPGQIILGWGLITDINTFPCSTLRQRGSAAAPTLDM